MRITGQWKERSCKQLSTPQTSIMNKFWVCLINMAPTTNQVSGKLFSRWVSPQSVAIPGQVKFPIDIVLQQDCRLRGIRFQLLVALLLLLQRTVDVERFNPADTYWTSNCTGALRGSQIWVLKVGLLVLGESPKHHWQGPRTTLGGELCGA